MHDKINENGQTVAAAVEMRWVHATTQTEICTATHVRIMTRPSTHKVITLRASTRWKKKKEKHSASARQQG